MELLDFVSEVWRKKWLISGWTLVPSLVFALVLYLSPRDYEASLQYPLSLDALELKKLTDRFFSGENLSRLIRNMEAGGLTSIPRILRQAESPRQLHRYLHLSATPDWIDYANKKNLRLSLERSWAENVEKLEELTAKMVDIGILGRPREELAAAIGFIRYNFEKELPLYRVSDDLAEQIGLMNEKLAKLQRNRMVLLLSLRRSEKILEKLKAIPALKTSVAGDYKLNLNFGDLNKESQFLPLSLQVQYYETEVARLGEIIAAEDRELQYDNQIQVMLKSMYEELSARLTADYDLDAFQAFLRQKQRTAASREERDFHDAYLKEIENHGLELVPLVRQTRSAPVAKGTVKTTAFVFCILLLLSLVTIALRIYIQRQEGLAEKTGHRL